MPDDVFLGYSELDIREVFRNTAEAVIATQRRFDGELGKAYLESCEGEGSRMLFSVPRTGVSLRFGVIETDKSKWRLVPWRKSSKSKQMHTHELNFLLNAVPTRASRVLPDVEGAETVSMYLSAPYFMHTPGEEREIKTRLLNALSAATPSWKSAIPGLEDEAGHKRVKELIGDENNGEIKAIKANKKGERGMVYFRNETTPASYLAVRVVGKDANDSVFVVTPGASPEVIIYSLDGDEKKEIRYSPLHHFLQTVRRWQAGALPPIFTKYSSKTDFEHAALEADNGLLPLLPFAESVRMGYALGLEYLTRPESESFMEISGQQITPSIFYDLDGVEAALSYSVEIEYKDNDDSVQRFDFQLRRTVDDKPIGDRPEAPDADEGFEGSLIESRALIRAARTAGVPRVEVELQTPEFVLSGTARARVIELARNSRKEIAEAFEDDGYKAFLENDIYRQGVIALLSYRGGEAVEKFLIVWPGSHLGKSRDFAFTCALNKERTTLKDVQVVLRVDSDLENVELTKDGEIEGKQYRAFHNFFHAVRIWRARMIAD